MLTVIVSDAGAGVLHASLLAGRPAQAGGHHPRPAPRCHPHASDRRRWRLGAEHVSAPARRRQGWLGLRRLISKVVCFRLYQPSANLPLLGLLQCVSISRLGRQNLFCWLVVKALLSLAFSLFVVVIVTICVRFDCLVVVDSVLFFFGSHCALAFVLFCDVSVPSLPLFEIKSWSLPLLVAAHVEHTRSNRTPLPPKAGRTPSPARLLG
jgi:hypothetical protein